ncbi:acyl transferase/acyl hydrolase/lysophospholipase [Roridomyces roridus]|uniref:Patatin-like phospholipase domain-containing protein n=1 Tax=Roridomyces roridus TaxID=1738132 RepID=A0AAD7C4S5_9AGAR|nr:acyl transferase/acyl hydrolase/lysophospholipase [Roridomyces roridus]
MTPASTQLEAFLAEDYVNETHIRAFAEALADADRDARRLGEPSAPPSPLVPTRASASSGNGDGVAPTRVSALSDFAPVNLRIKRRQRKDRPRRRDDWSFVLFRWPLLAFIFLFIALEFGGYVLLRQLVNVKEWISAWRGKKGLLRKNLRAARSYEEWKKAALVMDEYLKFDEWKKEDEDPFYDWKLVRKVHKSLKTLREKGDVRGVLGVLETSMRPNFAGVESPRLYSETYFGTKDLIEAYLEEQARALEFVRESPELKIDEKKRFFKLATTSLGVTALCLSGGASFGYYHVGVVRAFLDAGLLPKVITGTSAGGLVAALCCTRTDAELKAILQPQLAARITACEESIRVWAKRILRTGARFDPVLWAKKCSWFTRGELTFYEAYRRSGRILNISVIPADRHSPTRLLNYLTAPDTVIWSALLASAAVPGILPPVVLMQKLPDGSLVPWNWGAKFKDGSLRVDVPIQGLQKYFNVTHPIVSQVNPHVHLFFFAPRGSAGRPVAHRKGKGWRGNFILSAAEQWLKHELTKNFRLIRDLDLLPELLGQDWSSVFLQRFDGNVTIWPRTRFWDWLRILSDPDETELARMMQIGQIVTWPKLHMIANRAKLERQIYSGRQYVRNCLKAKAHAQTNSLAQTSGSERPISATDTDVERRPSRSKRVSPSHSGTTTPHSWQADPLRSPAARRRWASSLLREPQPPENYFLSKLRTRSFSALAPAASMNQFDLGEEAWSTDTSSEEELEEA